MARAPAVQEIEALPESDRLEGFPHPRETARLFGHDAAERAFAEAFAADRLHHAWLIVGRRGIGKATLAYRVARFLLATPQERTGPTLEVKPDGTAARQVCALSHPGLLVIRRPWVPANKRFAASIPIDEVRRLRSFLGHTAGAGANTWRVVIVDTADDLNPNAANALLKSLEEPPAQTIFMILASEPGRLLPTIRSRCRKLALTPLDLPDLRRATAAAFDAADATAPRSTEGLEQLADGSVRRFLELCANDGHKLYERVSAIVAALPKVDWPAAHALADELSSAASEERYETFFSLLLGQIARLIRASTAGDADSADVALASRLIPAGRAPQWADAWEAIVREKAEVEELNLDRRGLIVFTLGRLAEAAQR
jgi:DNA polymerase-3 subunit delta'